jgi:hypothetical protein
MRIVSNADTLTSIVGNAAKKNVSYLMINEVILHQGVVCPFACRRRIAALRLPPPHTPPLKIYQPKKEIFRLSAGNTMKFYMEGALYETDNTKETQNLRTLIRRIHITRKAVWEESNEPAVRRKDEKQKNHRLSFSARNDAFCENTGSFFNSSQRKEAKRV